MLLFNFLIVNCMLYNFPQRNTFSKCFTPLLYSSHGVNLTKDCLHINLCLAHWANVLPEKIKGEESHGNPHVSFGSLRRRWRRASSFHSENQSSSMPTDRMGCNFR